MRSRMPLSAKYCSRKLAFSLPVVVSVNMHLFIVRNTYVYLSIRNVNRNAFYYVFARSI